jgi:hypothetical protein
MPTIIQSLGLCLFDSPLQHSGALEVPFKSDAERVIVDHTVGATPSAEQPYEFEMAGPREKN